MAEASVTSASASEQAHATSLGLSNEKLGMWTLLGSECLFFGALISAYLIYYGRYNGQPEISPALYDIPFTSVSTFVLLMSSLGMVLALAAIQRGDDRGFRIWILSTALMGSVFLAGQIYEFTWFVEEGMTLTTSPFTSSFYVLTSFHGIHVTLGVVMLVTLWARSMTGRLTTEHAEAVENIGLYWHFVDIVWIVIFTAVYLIPYEQVAR
ncbi:MAG TPA: cytochrome c oxidase subunit 3 [Euzebyales bacterium]|nr:cytochrome c oxidase subunit 3 [Euzebyales bacterium]